MNKIEELLQDNYELDESLNASIDMIKFKENVKQFSSDKLCDIIVSHRYLGFNEEAAIVCMEELSNRRNNGDTFLFEQIIDEKQKELPEINFSIPDLRSVLSQFVNTIKVK